MGGKNSKNAGKATKKPTATTKKTVVLDAKATTTKAVPVKLASSASATPPPKQTVPKPQCAKNDAHQHGDHGDHHHHHGPPYVVPKADIYKVENAPQLLEVQRALAKKALKDPWARNEVWRYDVKHFSTHRSRLVLFLFRGLPAGAALAAATIGLEKALGINQPHHEAECTCEEGDHAHGHAHGAGHGHGGHGGGH